MNRTVRIALHIVLEVGLLTIQDPFGILQQFLQCGRIVGLSKQLLIGLRRNQGAFLDPVELTNRLYLHLRKLRLFGGDQCGTGNRKLAGYKSLKAFQDAHVGSFGSGALLRTAQILDHMEHQISRQPGCQGDYDNAQNKEQCQHPLAHFFLRLGGLGRRPGQILPDRAFGILRVFRFIGHGAPPYASPPDKACSSAVSGTTHHCPSRQISSRVISFVTVRASSAQA